MLRTEALLVPELAADAGFPAVRLRDPRIRPVPYPMSVVAPWDQHV